MSSPTKLSLHSSPNSQGNELAELFPSAIAQMLARGILEKHLLFHLPEQAAPICFLELPVSDHQRVRTSGFWILEQTLGGDALASDLLRFRNSKLIFPHEERLLWALASLCLAETLTGQQDVLGIFTERSTFGRYVLPTLLANAEVTEINLAAREDIFNLLRQRHRPLDLFASIGGGKNLMARSTVDRLHAFWLCTQKLMGLEDVLAEFNRCCEHESLKDMLFKVDQIDRQMLAGSNRSALRTVPEVA